MGAAGRQLVVDNFSKDEVNKATVDVYRTSMKNNGEIS
jgi:hypothetical protein